MMKTMLVAALLAAGLSAAGAQEEGMPGSVFGVPDPGSGAFEADHDFEILSDMGIFLDRGFTEADWNTHSDIVDEAARDLIFPDYEARTGRKAPEQASIDIATAMITKSGLNDLLVMSRLPGDCGNDGCLVQIWSMVGDKWEKRTEFSATGVAWKDGPEPGTTIVAAVGDEHTPSKMYIWNGTAFADW